MFIAGALAWPAAPESIPVHWNLAGEANRFGGKFEGLLLLPIITLAVLIGLTLLPHIDPRRERYAEFEGAFEVLKLLIVAFLAAVYAAMLAAVFGATLNMTRVVLPLVGVLLIGIGAVIGQVRPNWFVGIRTPWTLSSERAWSATHRAGRWVFIAMGAAMLLAGLADSGWALYSALLLCVAGVVGLVVYSYVVWRQDPH
jgi:uncharacterized membrane protein